MLCAAIANRDCSRRRVAVFAPRGVCVYQYMNQITCGERVVKLVAAMTTAARPRISPRRKRPLHFVTAAVCVCVCVCVCTRMTAAGAREAPTEVTRIF